MAQNSTAVTIEPRGVNNVINALENVRRSMAAKILKQSMDAAMKPMPLLVKSNVPVSFGTLRDSIDKRVKRYTRGAIDNAVVVGLVGPQNKYAETVAKPNVFSFKANDTVQKPSKYAHMVEFGTKPHFVPFPGFGRKRTRTRGSLSTRKYTFRHPGTKAQPFIQPAFQQGKGWMLAIFERSVLMLVKSEYAKAVQKGKKFFKDDQ